MNSMHPYGAIKIKPVDFTFYQNGPSSYSRVWKVPTKVRNKLKRSKMT